MNAIRSSRIFTEELAESPSRYVMVFRASMRNELEGAQVLNGAALIWSMWTGYLDRPDGQAL